jgi:SdrD B-like domain
MSEATGQTELQKQTQALFDGPLKHIRGAALAAALVPLASVLATPASAQPTACGSGGVCGFVFNDTNGNGIQDAGETGIEGAKVSLITPTETLFTETNLQGFYFFEVPAGTYPTLVQIPVGMTPSPANQGANDALDSDGVSNGFGFSVATTTLVGGAGSANSDTDFGFVTAAVQSPGTGTPGYWKNHPEAWPVNEITVGGVTYSRDEAIAWLGKVGKDKTTTMFSSLVSAMLNRLIGNDSSCVTSSITYANAWMATYGPVGSNVPASSDAWALGEPWHQQMDAYNNGRLCAPHRK